MINAMSIGLVGGDMRKGEREREIREKGVDGLLPIRVCQALWAAGPAAPSRHFSAHPAGRPRFLLPYCWLEKARGSPWLKANDRCRSACCKGLSWYPHCLWPLGRVFLCPASLLLTLLSERHEDYLGFIFIFNHLFIFINAFSLIFISLSSSFSFSLYLYFLIFFIIYSSFLSMSSFGSPCYDNFTSSAHHQHVHRCFQSPVFRLLSWFRSPNRRLWWPMCSVPVGKACAWLPIMAPGWLPHQQLGLRPLSLSWLSTFCSTIPASGPSCKRTVIPAP